LEGAEQDVLVVGSGNLTAAGQGGQLESVDAVSSIDEPAVFEQASRFFDTLRSKLKADAGPLADVLRYAAQRSSERGKDGGGNGRAWLIHTLEAPANAQLAAIAVASADAFRRLTVLSPFHAPDASPVIAFAKEVVAARIELAIDPRQRSISLDEARFVPPPGCRFVVPRLTDQLVRKSHAKWWELEYEGGLLVMTGSVNATEASFAGTANVEVALVRRLDSGEDEVPGWKEASPSFCHQPFAFATRDARSFVVHAQLREGGELVGQVLGAVGVPASASATLTSETATLARAELTLGDDGTFSVLLDKGVVEYGTPLQVQLRWGDCSAQGWVLNLYQLDLTDQERQSAAALGRISRGQQTAEDEERMLLQFERLLFADPLESPGATPPGSVDKAAKPAPGAMSAIKGIYTRPPSARAQRNRASLEHLARQALDAIHAYLQGRMRGHRHHPASAPTANVFPSADLQNNEPQSNQRPTETFEERFASIVARLPEVLRKKPNHRNVVELILIAAGDRLGHTIQLTAKGSARRCLAWVQAYTELGYSNSTREALFAPVLVMACAVVAAARYEAQSDAESQSWTAQAKDLVQRFGLDTSDVATMNTLCASAFSLSAFGGLEPDVQQALLDGVALLAQCQTAKDIVSGLLPDIRAGLPLAPTEGHRSLLGQAFFDAVRTHRTGRHRVGEIRRWPARGCPLCGVHLDKEQQNALARSRVAVCQNHVCRRPVVWVG
jgi:hypothetical protein